MNLFNVWKWPIEVYEDVRQWLIVRSALKESETIEKFKSFKYELRKDNIGRIYTVINVPEELLPFDKRDQVWPWMLEELRDLDLLLMDVRLNELVYPEVTRIAEYPAYLVILTPSVESFSFTKFFGWLFNVAFVSALLITGNKICVKFLGSSAIDIIKYTFY
jgi:hypothetical protein